MGLQRLQTSAQKTTHRERSGRSGPGDPSPCACGFRSSCPWCPPSKLRVPRSGLKGRGELVHDASDSGTEGAEAATDAEGASLYARSRSVGKRKIPDNAVAGPIGLTAL